MQTCLHQSGYLEKFRRGTPATKDLRNGQANDNPHLKEVQHGDAKQVRLVWVTWDLAVSAAEVGRETRQGVIREASCYLSPPRNQFVDCARTMRSG